MLSAMYCFALSMPLKRFVLPVGILLTGLCAVNAHAQSQFWSGRPGLGLAYEYEKMSDGVSHAQSITLAPGLNFKDAPVHRVELLINGERDKSVSSNVSSFSNLYKLAVRVGKYVPLQGDWGLYFRGLAGYNKSYSEKYFYGYSDGALRFQRNGMGLNTGLRVQRAFDGTSGHDLHKIWFGPRFEIADQHELELRWERGWAARSNVRESDAYILEYNYKF